MFLIPRRTNASAGVSNSKSKHVNIPKVTLKSVVKVDMSGVSVLFLPYSPKRLNLRYLREKFVNCARVALINFT